MNKLKVNKIFFSIQGEGANSGMPAHFIRLSGCSASGYCFKLGIDCDTDFKDYEWMTVEQIYAQLQLNNMLCNNIIWTGGEPTDQLEDWQLAFFNHKGYYQAIETSGINPVSGWLDYIAVSPKVPKEILEKNFLHTEGFEYIDEYRLCVTSKDWEIPELPWIANHYYLSPMFDESGIKIEIMTRTLDLVSDSSRWKVSVQWHKLVGID